MSKLSAVRIGRNIKLNDNTIWPDPNTNEISYLLRYGDGDDILKNKLHIASIVDAYQALINKSQQRRNKICSAIKDIVK